MLWSGLSRRFDFTFDLLRRTLEKARNMKVELVEVMNTNVNSVILVKNLYSQGIIEMEEGC